MNKTREFRSVYKCRLCGEYDHSIGGLATQATLLRMGLDLLETGDARLSPNDGIGVQKHDVHLCKDGSIGISDFIGFKVCGVSE